MAQQVTDVKLRLLLEGFAGLDKIKGSFRDLGKVTDLTAKDIAGARAGLREIAKEAGNTEAVTAGLISAFKGLRTQADQCGDTYQALSADLRELEAVSRGATQSIMAQREAVLASTAASTQNAAALTQQRAALVALRAQTRESSTAFDQFSQDIRQVETRLENLADVNRRFNRANTQGTAATVAGAQRSLDAIRQGISLRRQEIATIDLLTKEQRNEAANVTERIRLQQILNRALTNQGILQFQESARAGRERTRAAGRTFNSGTLTAGALSPEGMANRFGLGGQIPDTTAGLSQELGELNERLINTYRNTETYIAVQLRLAAVQREVTSATQGFGAALLADLNAGTLIPSQKNLAEVIGQLRREMLELDQTTTEGTRAYAQNAAEVDRLQQQLDKLAGAYRSVSAASRGATSQGTSRVTVGGERPFVSEMDRQKQRRDAVMGQREEFERLSSAADASGLEAVDALLSAKRTLAEHEVRAAQNIDQLKDDLHAKDIQRVDELFKKEVDAFNQRLQLDKRAQQIAATKQEMGFFAQSELSPFYGSIAEMGGAGAARQQRFMGRNPSQVLDDIATSFNAGGRTPPVPPSTGGGPSPAANNEFTKLNATLTKFGALNRRSVTDIRELGGALDALKADLSPLDAEYRQVNKSIEAQQTLIERELGRRERRQRRAPSTGQLVQAGGAAISGGIFGGPEGFLGGVGGAVLGTALPGIGTAGGAFAGAAAGAQVGMFRQQLAGTADYAASIGKLQIALRGVVGSQEAYDAAIRAAASATRDLNIPQEEATRGLTRLSAAVIGAGGTVADSSFAFRAMSEAIKATGGNAEQVDGALLALTQVFSKGKVSAEELNQIAERLPGTFTLFAQAAGKTGPELQKALEQGEVGLNDLMKFLELTSKRYGTTALEIAGSSQDAGARLTVAFQAMRLEVGKALQPLGAELQGTFAAFIKDITPAVVGSAKAIAAALSFFTNNEAAGGLARFALQAGVVALAIKGLLAASTSLVGLKIASWFAGAASGATQLQLPLGGATAKVGIFKAAVTGLGTALKALLPLTIITITVDVIVKGIAKLIAAREELKKLRNERNSVPEEGEGIGPKLVLNAQRRYTGASREKIIRDQQEQQKFVAGLRKQLQDLEATQSGLGTAYGQTAIGGVANIGRGFEQENTKAAIELLKEKITRSEEVLNLNVRTFKTEAEIEKARQAALSKKFADPTGGEDASTKASDKAARDAATVAAEQQRQNEAIAKAKIALDDAVFRNGMELIRKKYEYEQELEGKKRDLAVRSKTGGARESAALISSYFGELQTLTTRLTEAGRAVETATQDLKSAKAMAATTVGSAVGGGTSSAQTAQGYISKEQLRAYLISQGMGRTSGDFTNAGHKTPNHMLNAMDMGFTSPKYDSNYVAKTIEMERKLRATGAFGSQLYGPERDPRGHKDHLHIPTEGGRVPLTPGLASLMGIGAAGAGRQPPGVAAAARRDVAAEGGVDTAQANLKRALAEQALVAQQVKELSDVAGKSFVIDYTAAIREQNAALTDSASINELRNKLQLAGERPETIDAEIRKAEVIQRSNQLIADAKTELEGLDTTTAAGAQRATVLRDAIANQNTEIAKFKELTDAATASQIAFNEAMRTRQDNRIGLGMREGALAYVESVGTMREATAQLTQNGIKGLEDQLFSLVTTGKANFREFAAEILKQSARMILQLTIQRIIMQIIGAIGGGASNLGSSAANVAQYAPLPSAMGNAFAQNNIVPYAMGGAFTNSIVTKPTLFKFANGGTTRTGLMGEAGPEAIMPLSRGPNGKLGVASSGSGTTNVTVNVDASGNSQVAGDQAQGAQLGRVISQAVQGELIKQRRPGGLLAA